MFVCCECCVLSGRGPCEELITRPEESYRLWSVVVCDLENLKNEEAMTRVGSQSHGKKIYYYYYYYYYYYTCFIIVYTKILIQYYIYKIYIVPPNYILHVVIIRLIRDYQ